jgi:hypothetical protein
VFVVDDDGIYLSGKTEADSEDGAGYPCNSFRRVTKTKEVAHMTIKVCASARCNRMTLRKQRFTDKFSIPRPRTDKMFGSGCQLGFKVEAGIRTGAFQIALGK